MMNENVKNETIASFDARSFFKRWPWFYYSVATIFGPMQFTGLSAKSFLGKYPMEGKTLNIGSGPKILSKEVVNVDIHPYPGVEIIADGSKIPLQDESVSRIISDNVLEHVSLPSHAVAEMKRLLKKDGVVYFSTPFLYPFHSSPNDYQRWTKLGLIELFKDFEIIEIGVRAGPFSALTVYLNHIFSVIFSFGSKRLASLLLNLVMFITFPMKFLDIIFNHWPNAEEVSAVFYLVARKK